MPRKANVYREISGCQGMGYEQRLALIVQERSYGNGKVLKLIFVFSTGV
jgi:hypothetical protein